MTLEFDILDRYGNPIPYPAPSGTSGRTSHSGKFWARCLSGFLCGVQDAPFTTGGFLDAWRATFDGSDLVREEFRFGDGYVGVWHFDPVEDTGWVYASDDGRVYGGAVFDGDTYFWHEPYFRFTLANVERTLAHAPLPASTLLLASGLILLLALRFRALRRHPAA